MQLQQTFSKQAYSLNLAERELDLQQPLSDAVSAHIALECQAKVTLTSVVQRLQHTLEFLPACDPVMHVNYIWQV